MHTGPDEGRNGRSAPPDEVVAAKTLLRRTILALRSQLPAEDRARASAAICHRAATLPEFTQAATVMLFASFASEVDTATLVEQALLGGKTVCLPRVLAPRQMAAFRIRDPRTDLIPGTWGIREPRDGLPEVAPGDIDAVIVPGSVFDIEGRRYGYGGGFYDNFLPRTRTDAPRIALAFDLQVVAELATEPHDLRVDAIVTETRLIRRSDAFLPISSARRRV